MLLIFMHGCAILILTAPAFPYDADAFFLCSCDTRQVAHVWSLSKSLGSQSIMPLMA